MELKLHPYLLQLAHPFRISREAHDDQQTLIVSLHHGTHTGYGEATANPYYQSSIAQMSEQINAIKPLIESWDGQDIDWFDQMLQRSELGSFARCALDLAAHDLWGKMRGAPLWQLWGTSIDQYPTTNYTIGIDEVPVMLAKMAEKPWPIYKIKLGTDHDIDIVRALRAQSDAVFRVDANCAWTPEQTVENAQLLKDLGVQFIEQPLPAEDWSGMSYVRAHSVLPIIADESCLVESDVARCAEYFHGINIKLTKCGGLAPARRMIDQAKKRGLQLMVGCMTESTVGISAIAQLLPQLDYVDMDGALLLASDIASGIFIDDQAQVHWPELGGSGIALLADKK